MFNDASAGRPGSGGELQPDNHATQIPPCVNWGSQQWRLLRRALRDGKTIEEAAAIGGQSLIEAKMLIEIDRKRSPLPPEAFALLRDPDAPAAAFQPKENTMARKPKQMAREPEDEVEEAKSGDYKAAVRTLKNDVVPAKSAAASEMQAAGEGYKHIKKVCHVRPDAARSALRTHEMEDAMKEAYLTDLANLVNELEGYQALTYRPNNLFDRADDLATLSDDDDDDDDDDVVDDDFNEASEAELAQQAGRATKPAVTEPALH